MRSIGGPLPRFVNATRRSRHSNPPSSPPIRLVSWSTPLRANALYAAATPSSAPPERRILRQGVTRSSESSIRLPRKGQGQSNKKRGYLDSNRAWRTAHGVKLYRRERRLEPDRL